MTYEVLIIPVLWLFAFVSFVATSYFAFRKKIKWKVPLFIGLGAMVVLPAIGIVPAGSRGVIYRLGGGISETERTEGLALMVPWFQHLSVVSVRTQKVYSEEVYAQSLDLQEITVVASVNYHVDPNLAAELYRDVGMDYKSTIVQPAMFQQIKAAVGQIRAVDFAEGREQLAQDIQLKLSGQLAAYGILIEYVNIEDAIFDPAFISAVKAKVIADQAAEEQSRLIAAEDAKREQAIIQAEARARTIEIEAIAQARANHLLALSLTPDLLKWKWLSTWDGILPATLVGSDGSITFLLDGTSQQR